MLNGAQEKLWTIEQHYDQRGGMATITMRLFQELKELQGTLKLRYVWPGRDGAIMVRKSDNSKAIPIHSRQDLHKLQTFGQN